MARGEGPGPFCDQPAAGTHGRGAPERSGRETRPCRASRKSCHLGRGTVPRHACLKSLTKPLITVLAIIP